MKNIKVVNEESKVVNPQLAAGAAYWCKENDTVYYFKKDKPIEYYLKLSANGAGTIAINEGYMNADGFSEMDGEEEGWRYAKLDSSKDLVIDDVTYYAYSDAWGDENYYMTLDLSTYSKGDIVENVSFYYLWDEESKTWDDEWDGTLKVNKYDPSYSGPISETLSYTEGDEQEIKAGSIIVSINGNGFQTANTTLTAIEFPETMTTIGASALENCTSLASVTIPNTIVTMEEKVFNGCTSLEEVIIPDTVKTVGWSMFLNCTSLKNVVIGNGVEDIPFALFGDCTSLITVTLGTGIKTITNTQIFLNDKNIESVTIKATTPPTLSDSNLFYYIKSILVPAESLEAYKTAAVWSNLASKIKAIEE